MKPMDPWENNEEAHYVLNECVKALGSRIEVIESVLNQLMDRVDKMHDKCYNDCNPLQED